MQPSTRDLPSVLDDLLADHQRLDARLNEVIEAAKTGEPETLRQAWNSFETALAVHLSDEEGYVLALLLRQGSPSARAIVQEHKHLRARILEIETCIDLHAVRLDMIETFAAELRAHMHHEDGVLRGLAESAGAAETSALRESKPDAG